MSRHHDESPIMRKPLVLASQAPRERRQFTIYDYLFWAFGALLCYLLLH